MNNNNATVVAEKPWYGQSARTMYMEKGRKGGGAGGVNCLW